jgi:hypothetical protein
MASCRPAMIISMAAVPGAGRDGAVLEGALERITYANPETGYTIARIDTGRCPDLVTAVGPLLGAQVGESLRMRGRWTSHPKFGKQFEVFSYTTVLPATVQGIQRYLGSGLAYTLSEAADDGHCFLPVPNLITDAAKILEVPAEMISPCLDELAAAEGVIREDLPPVAENSPSVPAVYLPPFYHAERSVAAAPLPAILV